MAQEPPRMSELRLDAQRGVLRAAFILFGLLIAVSHGSSIAQQRPLPDKADQKKITDWLEACNLNGDLGSVTCAEIKHCAGEMAVKKDDHPLIYELMRDPNGNGIVCEHWQDGAQSEPKRKGDVVFGIGIATGVIDRRVGPREAVGSEGNLLVADFRGGETRPVATASYLIPRRDTARVRPGLMVLLDADIVAEDGLVKPRGVGLGVTVAFRGTLGDNWTQAFGVGVAYLWESADLLSGGREPELVNRTVDSVLLVVTYSFGKRWWQ